MSTPRPRGLPPTCLLETAEGPVTMAETPNKGFALMTRLPSGVIGFRQLIKVTTSGPVPLVRVVFDNGHAVVTAAGHPFFRRGMEAVAAEDLQPGDLLETAFQYPEGYAPPDLPEAPPATAVAVRRVEAAGEGEVMSGTVRDTHAFFLTAGVLCSE
ncbi:MAG TPA: Hint domain-containing protein [Candidatus Binatia bacterium]|nr:Hint domain-containing protein [Candidatus Binatia bacterium]